MLSSCVLQLNMELQSVLFEIEEAISRPDPEPVLTEMIHQVISLLIKYQRGLDAHIFHISPYVIIQKFALMGFEGVH